jgi:membrane-bound ClpP family serine protease
MSYGRGCVSKEDGAMMKTVLIAGSIALVVGFCVTLLTLFGPATQAAEYLKFAMMLLLFVVILIGSYWFVMVPTGRNGRRENPTGRDDEEGTREP